MKKIHNIALGGLFCMLFMGSAAAQQVQVSASIDSTAMPIGQQTLIHLEATQPVGRAVQFPVIADTIIKGVEVLQVLPLDTVSIGNDRITVRQDVLVTSFDSALYYIPPFKFVMTDDSRFEVKSDTFKTNALALKIVTYDIPEGENAAIDIKDVKDVPFVFSDYYAAIISVLIFFILVIGSILGYREWKRRKDHPELLDDSAPKLPPHQKALMELDELDKMKLWQQGFNKEYYTQLTDVLREYIVERFHIGAMEMTSNEIIDALRKDNVEKNLIGYMKQISGVSDFVKFAKMTPLADDNEQSMLSAKAFVSESIVEEKPAEPSDAAVTPEPETIKKQENDIR